LTRSLGDLLAKKIGIISEPEIHHIEIQKGDRFICLGTDGLFDVMNSAEVCGFI
jgi:integrin-linked kinase-associated serine/threonine phosphatase 2C